MFIKKFISRILMSPFALLYGAVVLLRNFCYDKKIFKSKSFNIPIISIGNISVGGTGKTPHTEFIFRMLQKEFKIAVLSRGYKRRTKGYREVLIEDSYRDVGDESLQIKRKFPNAVVAVCENRVEGVEKLLIKYDDIDVIILDDAFQHRRISPSISIVLNDFNFSITKDYLLPMGRLREPLNAIYRADIVICTKCPEDLSPIESRIMDNDLGLSAFQDLFFSTQRYLDLLPVFNVFNRPVKLDELRDYNLLLVTGIARSGGLVDFLKPRAKSIKHISFSDHHNFKKREIAKVESTFNSLQGKKIIVLTEKDSVRLIGDSLFSDNIHNFVYYIPIEVVILGDRKQYKKLETKIFRNVRANKRNSRLHKATN